MLKLRRTYKYFTIEYEQLTPDWIAGRVLRNGKDLISCINRTTRLAVKEAAIYEIECHIRYEKQTLRSMIGFLSRKKSNA